MQLIRLPEVIAMTSLSKATIYRRIKEGEFPKGASLGGGVRAWDQQEVEDWILSKFRESELGE